MNKIAIAQINTIAGDITYNENKIKTSILSAIDKGADLIIFPELALSGCPITEMFSRHNSIIKRQLESLNKIALLTKDITAIIGFTEPNNINDTKPFFSSVAVLKDGAIVDIIRNELNDFKIIEINGEKFAVCLGDNPDLSLLVENNVDTVIDCSCSESVCGKEYAKNIHFSSIANKYKVNYIYVNQAGYSDNLCFDGTSRIYNKTGELSLRLKSFEEDFIITEDYIGKISDLPNGMNEKVEIDNFKLDYKNDLARTYKSIILAIREYFSKNGFTKAVLGLSGGLDSTVSAVLLADALGRDNVYGISMPSKITSKESKNDAKELADNLGINFFEIPLADSLDNLKDLLNTTFSNIKTETFEKSTTIENLQARLRATILWSVSNEYKQMLPIATSDKSEAYIGYATVNGDMSGGFAPIIDVTKTKLFALADFLNKNREQKNAIPPSILEKPPGAELKINPKTGKTVCAEEENMPYEFLDEIIWYVENHGYGKSDLLNHKFYYESKNAITIEQKEEWINKFFWKSKCAVYKWHIVPPSVIVDINTINSSKYRQPIISKVY